MGSKAERRRRFLAEHPVCCFCGGVARAEEEDHIPARTLFTARHWPEGYVFPACSKCNRRTRHAEQALSVLSRCFPDPKNDEERQEIQRLAGGLVRNQPELATELYPSGEAARSAARKYFPLTAKPKGGFLVVNGPKMTQAMRDFATKLFLALYYKHAERIVKPEGSIAFRWWSNIQITNDEIPRDLATITPGFPSLERSRKPLNDQFFYRYGVSDDKRVAAFLAFFREAFAVLGFVDSEKTVDFADNEDLLRPFAEAAA